VAMLLVYNVRASLHSVRASGALRLRSRDPTALTHRTIAGRVPFFTKWSLHPQGLEI
jgi:hypothetical protein